VEDMQFVSFIASLVLIVVISQQSTMGLPVSEEPIEKECSEGLKLVEGECVPVDRIRNSAGFKRPVRGSRTRFAPKEESFVYTEKPVVIKEEPALEKQGACREGWEHGKYGICQEMKQPKPTKLTREPKPVLEEDAEPKSALEDDRKPKPALEEDSEQKPALKEHRRPKPVREEDAEPKPVLKDDRRPKLALEEDAEPKPALKEDRRPKPVREEEDEPKSDLKENRRPKPALEEDAEPKSDLKENRRPKPAREEDAEPKSDLKENRRPKPARDEDAEPKSDLKEDRKSKPVVEEDAEEKSDLKEDRKPKPAIEEDAEEKSDLKEDRKSKPVLKEDPEREENLSRCPEGTKHDERGSCQEIEPSSTKKVSTDLKSLLKKDGSCPDNYKMVEGKCLYIKPKTKTTLYPDGTTADVGDLIRIRPKSGNEGTNMFEKVPLVDDNSCPEGTEYSEYGICQRRIRPSNSTPIIKAHRRCPNGFELVNGKCTYKTPTTQDEIRSSTVKTSTLSSTSEATTSTEEPINNRKSFEPLTTSQSAIEISSPQSVIEITTPESVIVEVTTSQSVIEMTTAKASSDELQSQTTSRSL